MSKLIVNEKLPVRYSFGLMFGFLTGSVSALLLLLLVELLPQTETGLTKGFAGNSVVQRNWLGVQQTHMDLPLQQFYQAAE